MHCRLQIKNYRTFADSLPAAIDLQSGLTALVGPNNSGKSSILKLLYEFRQLFTKLSEDPDSLTSILRGNQCVFQYPDSVPDAEGPFHRYNERPISLTLSLAEAFTLTLEVPRGTNVAIANATVNGTSLPRERIAVNSAWELLVRDIAVIPLRALREALQSMSSTVYFGAFRNAINVGENKNYYDIPTGVQFVKMWRAYQTGHHLRQNRTVIRITDEIRRVLGFSSLQINATDDEQSLQVVVNGEPFRLNDMGSGLAQFILTLATAAITRPAFILIDEPELNLHPSLQMEFLTTLAGYAREGIFFSTHSYGLARATADRIYSVRRVADNLQRSELRELDALPSLAEFLGELGYSGYRELGFSKVLLVEGTTELKAVRHLLRLFGKDHEVVLIHLHGSSSIKSGTDEQLSEVIRLCEQVYALIDSERDCEAAALDDNRKGFVETCNRLGIACHVLQRRAIENYFTQDAINREYSTQGYKALGAYERAEDRWRKKDGWRIARWLAKSDLDGTDLGTFLATL